jgi:hypothetical protein
MSEEATLDMNFLGLVMAHQQAGLQHLGKMANPMTGKVERELQAVQGTIAILETLERKTRGNLVQEEEQALQESLTFLRLNYLEEVKVDQASQVENPEEEPVSESEETPSD